MGDEDNGKARDCCWTTALTFLARWRRAMLLRAAKQNRIYVVQARRHYGRCDKDCHVVIQRWADVPQWADVIETRFRYWLGVVVHSKVRIECCHKDFDYIWQWNNCASYIQRYRIGYGLDSLRRAEDSGNWFGWVESHPIFAKPRVKGSQALLKRVDIVT